MSRFPPDPSSPGWRAAIVVTFIALVLRVSVLVNAAPDATRLLSLPDSSEYVAIAKNLGAGHGFSASASTPYVPDVRRTPVYPAMLAAVFAWPHAGLRAAALANVMAGTSTVFLTYVIARRLFGHDAAVAAGVVLALDVGSVSFSVVVLTEALFAALVAAGIWLLVRRPEHETAALGAGVVLGAAALCRPIGVALGPAMLLVCAWPGAGPVRITRRYLALNGMFVAVVALWVLRNWAVAGVPTISSIGAVNLYFHRAAIVQARLEGRDPDDVRREWEREFKERSSAANEQQRMAWQSAAGWRIIFTNPGVYLHASLEGLGRMARPDTDEAPRLFGTQPGTGAARRLYAIGWLQLLATYALAAAGLTVAVLTRDLRPAALVLLTPIVYFAAMAGPEAYPRFRTPLMPFVAILAGLGWQSALAACRRFR